MKRYPWVKRSNVTVLNQKIRKDYSQRDTRYFKLMKTLTVSYNYCVVSAEL